MSHAEQVIFQGACASALVRKYKVRHLISLPPTPHPREEKKREKNRTIMMPPPQGGWVGMVTINPLARFNPLERAKVSP